MLPKNPYSVQLSIRHVLAIAVTWPMLTSANQTLQAGDALRDSITSGTAFDDPAVLWRGLLLVYADLKRHSYSYCAAFPYLKLPQQCTLQRCQPLAAAYPDTAPAIGQALLQEHEWPVLLSAAAGGEAAGAPKVPPNPPSIPACFRRCARQAMYFVSWFECTYCIFAPYPTISNSKHVN